MTITETEKAWLAGLWDGEGSVGFTRSGAGYRLAVQLVMTCPLTVETAIERLQRLGVRGLAYTYQEKQSHHRDAYYVRVNRAGSALLMGEALLPYAVTKREHWRLALEWLRSRIEKAGGLDEHGRIKRGGYARHPVSAREAAIVDELRGITCRPRPTTGLLSAMGTA